MKENFKTKKYKSTDNKMWIMLQDSQHNFPCRGATIKSS